MSQAKKKHVSSLAQDKISETTSILGRETKPSLDRHNDNSLQELTRVKNPFARANDPGRGFPR